MDIALVVLRLVLGMLLAGHGAQKLFGWFDGHGRAGTGGWFESLGLRPGIHWATLAGLSEFVGGLLTALGLFSPLGPIAALAVMVMAAGKAHWGKPIWVTAGGPELPVVNMAGFVAIGLAGPGIFSLDYLWGTDLPPIGAAIVVALAVAGTAIGLAQQPPAAQPQAAAAGVEGEEHRVVEPVSTPVGAGEPVAAEQRENNELPSA